MGQVIEADFRRGVVLTDEDLDDFDFELSCALDALPRCLTTRDEELLQAHFETLLARAECGMRASK